MKDYVVWHPDYAGWRTLFETRREACDYCDAMEKRWADLGSPFREPFRITYYGREVHRDDLTEALEMAARYVAGQLAYAKRNGKLRNLRGGLVAVT